MLNRFIIGLMAGIVSGPLLAQTTSSTVLAPKASAYAVDGNGTILRSGDGLCWRTGYWTPEDAVKGCDGELLPPVSKATAPAIVPAATVTAQATVAPVVASAARCDFTLTLEGDQIFAFNKTALTKAAKNRIDHEVLPKLSHCGVIDIILISGHSDRLGTPKYNQALSAKRAATVASYLKSKNVSALMETQGYGATQPVTTCHNKTSKKKLIACLAPNRRAVIEVRGTAK
jgi:OmpA-OmpF porin, OOP family